MNNTLATTNKILRKYLFGTILLSVIAFLVAIILITKQGVSAPNIILERYAILITLIGIPFSLRFFHLRLKKISDLNTPSSLNKYRKQYFIRLSILLVICLFNIISLYITGAKNFHFMVIITIFAYFLCTPLKESPQKINDDELDENN